ncbi:S-4TM family putative pore-forming effector [Nocardia vinacea]|uniref:S-4TM family putative pore-forming effector n=1 Tax=Nocardia vinacea TaxID=96468 RepID=UPI002E1166CC|nr:S-4TM family putative pore-forming effector [Nocardia vinacea]
MLILGASCFLVSVSLLEAAARGASRERALLQEMFDTLVFHLPWRSTVAGEPVAQHDVARLARGVVPGSRADQWDHGGLVRLGGRRSPPL